MSFLMIPKSPKVEIKVGKDTTGLLYISFFMYMYSLLKAALLLLLSLQSLLILFIRDSQGGSCPRHRSRVARSLINQVCIIVSKIYRSMAECRGGGGKLSLQQKQICFNNVKSVAKSLFKVWKLYREGYCSKKKTKTKNRVEN